MKHVRPTLLKRVRKSAASAVSKVVSRALAAHRVTADVAASSSAAVGPRRRLNFKGPEPAGMAARSGAASSSSCLPSCLQAVGVAPRLTNDSPIEFISSSRGRHRLGQDCQEAVDEANGADMDVEQGQRTVIEDDDTDEHREQRLAKDRQFTGCTTDADVVQQFRGHLKYMRKHEAEAAQRRAVGTVLETLYVPSPAVTPGQSRRTSSTTVLDNTKRGEMVEWIVQVQEMFGLGAETLFLAVRTLDNFVATMRTPILRPLLPCAAALLVAAKFEEENYPPIKELVKAAHHSFTEEELEQVELNLLHRLDFRLHQPTATHYLRGLEAAFFEGRRPHEWSSSCSCAPCMLRPLAQYLCELGLTCQASVQWMPSLHAVASLLLAARLLKLESTDKVHLQEVDTQLRAKLMSDIVKQLQEAMTSSENGRVMHRKHLLHAGSRVEALIVGDLVSAVESFDAECESWGSGRILPGTKGIVRKVYMGGSGIVTFADEQFRISPQDFPHLCVVTFKDLARVVKAFGVPLKEISGIRASIDL